MNATMLKHTRTFASLVAAGSLLAAPAIGQAAKPASPGKSGTHSKSTKNCKTHSVGFSVGGTYVSHVADNPLTTDVNEGTVTFKITSANSAARLSGDIADQNTTKKGVQVKGAIYTVPTTDAYTLRLNGYEGADTPSAGDKVKVNGRIALTSKRCAPAGTSLADRLGDVNVRTVTISDRDTDV